MDGGLAALLGALIGAGAMVLANVMHEAHVNHNRRRSAAAILHAEIQTALAIASARNSEANFAACLPLLDAGQYYDVGRVITKDPQDEGTYERTVALARDLPAAISGKVVEFAALYLSIQGDIYRISMGEFRNAPDRMAAIIREDLALWDDAKTLAKAALPELLRLSETRFVPWRR